LSFSPGREVQAEKMLSKAIKLDPKLLRAWNALGEVHWNTQSYQRARECFENAIKFCGENPISLRNLSMVLRAVDGEATTREDGAVAARRSENFADALEKAKQAVALDAADPQNWETLGNAYVGDFFVNARRPDELSRALIAYSKAEAAYAKLGKNNPSVQLNRGMAASYIEDYDLALRSFRKAEEIGAATAAKEGQKVMELVQRLAGYTQRKGDLKAKHLKELLEDFSGKQLSVGYTPGGAAQRSLRDLRTNAGSADAPFVAKVVNIVDRHDELPMIMICCDAFGEFFALSLYNAQSSKVADVVVPMKSLLNIRQAKFREVSVTAAQQTWNYPSVRVSHPGDIIVVGSGSLAAAAGSSSFSAVALKREEQAEEVQKPKPVPKDPLSDMAASPSPADLKQERWIDQEDAKIKKTEAKAKAKAAAANAKTKGSKKKDRSAEKPAAKSAGMHLAPFAYGEPQLIDSDADTETNTGTESVVDKETVEGIEEETPEKLQKPSEVRWSDLDDSSDDEWVPRQVSAQTDDPILA
jgi:Flp pilus assembly protein TadD